MYEGKEYEPLQGSHGNISGEIAHLRDTFLSAEYDYLKALIQIPEFKEFVVTALDYPPEELFKEATKRIDRIENGEVKESDLEQVEAEITILLASIQDEVLLKELILSLDNNESRGRSL